LIDYAEKELKHREINELEDCIEYYEWNSYDIEVIGMHKELKTMKIVKLPHHKHMMIDRTVKEFEESVDRTNAKTKCAGLYEISPKVIKELYYTH